MEPFLRINANYLICLQWRLMGGGVLWGRPPPGKLMGRPPPKKLKGPWMEIYGNVPALKKPGEGDSKFCPLIGILENFISRHCLFPGVFKKITFN